MAVKTGNAGNNLLNGTANDDRLSGLAGKDTLIGKSGDDKLYGGSGNDLLVGHAGKDSLYGGSGRDTLVGNEGNDRLFGGAGRDVLDGGDFNSTLSGGFGEDVFRFTTGTRKAFILDFKDNVDTIHLDSDLFPGLTKQQIIEQFVTSSGGDTTINLSETDDQQRIVILGLDNGFKLSNDLILS